MKRLCFFVLFLMVMACEKIPVNPINASVYLRLDLNNRDKVLRGIPSYRVFSLSKPGVDYNPAQNERIGLGGLLVVRTPVDTWSAFDLACPNEQIPGRNAIVEVDKDGIYAICPHCGTKYQILDGTGIAVEGKRIGLKSYSISVNVSSGIGVVSN
jgi:hypothetical protein